MNDEKTATLLLTMDILEHILDLADNPGELGEFLTRQMSELLGARGVVLLRSFAPTIVASHEIVSVCPKELKEALDCPELHALAALSVGIDRCELWSPEEGPEAARMIISARDWGPTIALHLHYGAKTYGVLLVIGLSERERARTMLGLLDSLTHVITLVLKNSLIYEDLEREIEIRTREISRQARLFRSLTETSPVGIFRTDGNGKLLYVNGRWCQVAGIAREDALSRPWTEFIDEGDRERILGDFAGRGKEDSAFVTECRYGKSGIWVIAEVAVERDGDDRAIGYIGSTTDISSRKLAEEETRSALKEKEILLRELYHRTKNNMQVICAMLSLQSHRMTDGKSRLAFAEMENKIHSMALVHRMLYESRNLSQIDFSRYIVELASMLVSSYAISPDRVALEFDLESIPILIDSAIPCGLILNELISNALKYAFPEGRRGRILVKLRKLEEGRIELRVDDDGVGLPPGFDIAKASNMGLQTIFYLGKEQLQAEVDFESRNGFSFTLRFRTDTYAQRV